MDAFIIVAPQDYPLDIRADFVCSGRNDELTIQRAIDVAVKERKNIMLLNGVYHIDGFHNRYGDNGPDCAICLPIAWREIQFLGQNNQLCTRNFEKNPGGELGDLMREVYPGTWCGNIDFTAQPAWSALNSIDFQLWENDGSGVGIKTRNNCHKAICTTAERLSYYPMYGQQIFDTDLNKMVICIDPEHKKWVDFSGERV